MCPKYILNILKILMVFLKSRCNGVLIHDARIERGLTQEELAEKVGTTKSYISKIENNIKEVRISTLQRIIELGLGGQLQLSIKL